MGLSLLLVSWKAGIETTPGGGSHPASRIMEVGLYRLGLCGDLIDDHPKVRAFSGFTSKPLKNLPPPTINRQHNPMFTGIVEEAGIIKSIKPTAKGIELTVRAAVCGRGLQPGASVSVNGCCLTAVKITPEGRVSVPIIGRVPKKKAKLIRFDLLQESWRLTNLQYAKPGARVNLERSLRANGELGGHFVSGHVDGLGKIVRWERAGKDHVLDIAAPPEVMRYVIMKGSIAVDGMSLTVAGVKAKSFRIWIIPHTYEITALKERKVGDYVNLEADLLGKYVEKFLAGRRKK